MRVGMCRPPCRTNPYKLIQSAVPLDRINGIIQFGLQIRIFLADSYTDAHVNSDLGAYYGQPAPLIEVDLIMCIIPH